MDVLPQWIDPEAWAGFCAMRAKIKKPLTDRAKRMLFKRLTELHEKGHDVTACLEQSEFHCWQDVYELKDKSIQRAQGPEPATNGYLADLAAHKAQATTGTAEQRQKLEALRNGSILKRIV